ncbi:MAG: DNA polymerase III subunit beta, partial [Candidatus Omnitrophica bacterium]|nr:DNA polymerase III subunit beta [Candidatus Omnitrophota bacterium]
VISKNTPEIGESREEIEAEYNGEEMVIGFNPHFLIDFLKNINAEFIEMEVNGADKPAVIRLKEYLYLALPMRI